MKINLRYLVIEASGKDAVEKVILDGIGTLGWAEATPSFLKIHNSEKLKDKVILSINRKSLDKIRACFELSKEKIVVKKVSGTIKGLS